MRQELNETFRFQNGVVLRNRAVMAPMTIGASTDGYVSDADVAYYARRATSVGMIITGCAYVDPKGQAFGNSLSVAEDDKIPGLARIAQAIQEKGCKAILQIYHGGRMVFPDLIGDAQPVAPSAVRALRSFTAEPRALEPKEVEDMLQLFLDAISRAIKAGFDGVELHGANTYLIQQFFSPHSNIRYDKWGGSLNNRMRFSKTLVKRAKQLIKAEATKPFLLGFRFSPEEIENPGITLTDTLAFLNQLIISGVDYLHTSMKSVWRGSLRDSEDSQPIIHKIVKRIRQKVPLIAVGDIRTGQDAQRVLEAGIPLFSLGKPMLLDPEWIDKAVNEQDDAIRDVYADELQAALALPDAFVEELRGYLLGEY